MPGWFLGGIFGTCRQTNVVEFEGMADAGREDGVFPLLFAGCAISADGMMPLDDLIVVTAWLFFLF